MKPIFLIPAALLLLYAFPVFSQQTGLTGENIGISYSVSPPQSFRDTTGSFSSHSVRANISIPLMGNIHKQAGSTITGTSQSLYQVSAHAGFEYLHSTIGFIKEQRDFYNAFAGLGCLLFKGRKNIILADASIGIASDRIAIQNNDLRYRFSGALIVNNIHSSSVTYQYGIVMTYAYGRPLPLPVLGIRKKMPGSWSFSAILPLSVRFTNKLNKNMSVSFLLKPAGERFQFYNQHDFVTSSHTVYMQLRQFQLGASYYYRFARQFSVGAEAGLLTRGKLRFTEPGNSSTVLYETGIKGGARFGFSFRYHLPWKSLFNNEPDIDSEMFRIH